MTLGLFLAKMAEIIQMEERTFSYRDFLLFKYKEGEYKFTHETIRNYFSILRKQGKIEKVGKTNPAFYTLSNQKTSNPMTLYHGGVSTHKSIGPTVALQTPFHTLSFNHKQNNLYGFLNRLSMDKDAIHDIRLWFRVKGLWEVIQLYSDYGYPIKSMNLKSNMDVVLEDLDYRDHIIKTVIHRTDGVSISIACTASPIPLDMLGLVKLSSGLARIEEKLQRIVDEYLRNNLRSNKLSSSLIAKGPIPDYKSWTVKMWHFGQDSLTCYTGDMFEISWGDSLGVFHVYSKRNPLDKKKVRVRKEVQERPNKPWFDLFMERTRYIEKNGPGYFNERFNEYL